LINENANAKDSPNAIIVTIVHPTYLIDLDRILLNFVFLTAQSSVIQYKSFILIKYLQFTPNPFGELAHSLTCENTNQALKGQTK
jgi:hypothetical protein